MQQDCISRYELVVEDHFLVVDIPPTKRLLEPKTSLKLEFPLSTSSAFEYVSEAIEYLGWKIAQTKSDGEIYAIAPEFEDKIQIKIKKRNSLRTEIKISSSRGSASSDLKAVKSGYGRGNHADWNTSEHFAKVLILKIFKLQS